MNKIIKVNLGKLNTITIKTDDLEVMKGDYFVLQYKNKNYKFEVFEIEINEDYDIFATLLDIGYRHTSIKNENAKILSSIIGKEVEKITEDKEKYKFAKERDYI